MSNSTRYKRGRSKDRLLPENSSTSNYNSLNDPSPPYDQTSNHSSGAGGSQASQNHQYKRDSSAPRNSATNTIRCIYLSIALLVLAQAGAFFFFYDLPTKLGEYGRATARMREQQGAMKEEARHLERERIGLWSEANRLEDERLALESSTRELEGERNALESAIRRSELERSRLEREKQLLESERQSLERQEESLREEREKWERAREDRVPQGAFWDPLWAAWDCRAYGKREYWGELKNIPQDWTPMEACTNMPAEIKGVNVRRPYRCAYVDGSPHIHGFWVVDWDQPDCKPKLQDITDTGCTNPGSGTRRIEAWVMDINDKGGQDWRILCESTPMTWNHVTYNSPTHCEAWLFGKKAIWDIPDDGC